MVRSTPIGTFLAEQRHEQAAARTQKCPGCFRHPGHFLTDLLLTALRCYPPHVIATAVQKTKPLPEPAGVPGVAVGAAASLLPVGATPKKAE